MEVSSHEDSASEFCCVGSIFSMKVLGFVSKAIKLLLTELVGQCKNILPLAFSALTSQYGKSCWQYIPVLTSHSVNKSIMLCRLEGQCDLSISKVDSVISKNALS